MGASGIPINFLVTDLFGSPVHISEFGDYFASARERENEKERKGKGREKGGNGEGKGNRAEAL